MGLFNWRTPTIYIRVTPGFVFARELVHGRDFDSRINGWPSVLQIEQAFYHPRVFIRDLDQAAQILSKLVSVAYPGGVLRPDVVFHPALPGANELTQTETAAIMNLCERIRARRVYVLDHPRDLTEVQIGELIPWIGRAINNTLRY